MPSLKSIKSPARSLSIDFSGVPVQVTYDPNVITPRLEEEMKAASAAGESTIKQYLSTMVKWITAWDLTEDDEVTPLPITVETMLDFPDSILTAISKALMADMRPNQQSS
jgi:hypothetical protein